MTTHKTIQRQCPKCGCGATSRSRTPGTLVWKAQCEADGCDEKWLEDRTGEKGLAEKLGVSDAPKRAATAKA